MAIGPAAADTCGRGRGSRRPDCWTPSRSDKSVWPCLALTLNEPDFPTPGAVSGVLTLDRWRALDNESHRLPLPATLVRTPDDSAARRLPA
jgi:hypothetical protein